ncbi:hypothetical protein [Pectobacterium sp. A5351]|uniref:hypothetical protein n=1 Tax=Pectobacterium sp. A5351 TaxID=2914983 RepID=UPI0023308DD8|nr:hypothetical protein [Pectobacterium sp. A5351]WCG83009.1 hypothetical protein O1Q74_19440 [Pectobacterium sp. A5351]
MTTTNAAVTESSITIFRDLIASLPVDHLRPVAKIVPLTVTEKTPRIGFMKGQVSAPDNFNDLNKEEIIDMFNGKL